ncbi:NADP-dependent oxidoreductase [Streptomyces boncukensis]|uniref:NADP-dependent oxidoreductase n=1 Tax=Streptomyces boncukensis TaxID=2711219 RepID=A0A6G4X1A1_9ACTN|nr:NADP-dependent oxidoreductase [Streptomyces boncukensis]NGO71329.1 NADP-dependent oxidoreductase [Streptomyces boncukensis]
MRAIAQDEFGGVEVLKETELERPKPGIGQVLLRVRAAGVNPTDWKNRSRRTTVTTPLPLVLGWDVSGVVEETGFGVALHAVGDEVFGMLPYPNGVGAFAEYVLAPARALVPKPDGIDHVQAGALPLAALTAWQALVDTAGLRTGQRALIHAAAGGVGHLAVQIAKARGAYVIGTASAPKHEFVRGLGADEVIDYRSVDFAEAVRDVDVAFDTVGEDIGARSLPTLREGGILVTILAQTAPALQPEADRLGVRAVPMIVEHDQQGMREIAALAEAGTLRAEIAGTFPLADVAKAHEAGETGRTTGKLVLTL